MARIVNVWGVATASWLRGIWAGVFANATVTAVMHGSWTSATLDGLMATAVGCLHWYEVSRAKRSIQRLLEGALD